MQPLAPNPNHFPILRKGVCKPLLLISDASHPLSFLHEEFNDPNTHDSIYLHRIGKSFDGYAPVVAYIPQRKILVFGYADGIGG